MRVLIVGPSFFGYVRDVASELSGRGHEVDVVPDRPSEGVLFRSAGRIDYRLVDARIRRHWRSLVGRVRGHRYQMVLVIGCMSSCFTRAQYEGLRSAAGCPMVAYCWDSVANCQRLGPALGAFDAALSFDPRDCERLGMSFLPLFWAPEFGEVPTPPEGGYEWDACFVGSAHQPEKLRSVLAIADGLEAQGARVLTHLYMPSRSVAALRCATSPLYRGGRLSLRPMPRAEVISLLARSRTVIDSPQAGQRGLTIRCLEALGAGRRLLTANASVRGYDFYGFGNVSVCEGGLPDAAFATSDPIPVPDEVRRRYSIASWCDAVLLGEGVAR